MTARRQRHEYAVRYRRIGWESRQVRFFQSRPAAQRFLRKLRTPSSDYAPIIELTVERREVGPWVEVDTSGWSR